VAEKMVVAVTKDTWEDYSGAPHETRLVSIAGEPDIIWNNSSQRLLDCAIARPGVIDVIDTKTMALIEEVHTEEGVHTLAFDNVRQRLYAFLPAKNNCLVNRKNKKA